MARKATHRRLPPPPPEGKSAATAAVSGRRQPVILADPSKPGARFAEIAGGTAAGCAAICCCCPCGLVNLLVLTVVRLPAGLCRKALRKRRAKRRAVAASRKKAALLAAGERTEISQPASAPVPESWPASGKAAAAEKAEMEIETWAKLYSTGFWRSPSQRE